MPEKIEIKTPAIPPVEQPTGPASGLTKREWFAGQALSGLLGRRSGDLGSAEFREAVAHRAVAMADLMMRALAEPQ